MRKLVILALLVTQTAALASSADQPVSPYYQGDLQYRDIMYTTEGELLLREVTNKKQNWFDFEECSLVRSNEPAREGHAVGVCYELSPKYINDQAARYTVSDKFRDSLKSELHGLKVFKRFVGYVFPLATAWVIKQNFVLWNKFYSPAYATMRFKMGLYATLVSTVATLMGALVWDAWTTHIPSLETSLQKSDLRAEDKKHGALKGEDIYFLIRTALREAIDDPAVHKFQVKKDLNFM